MPFENEHSVRLKNPAEFDKWTFRRTRGGSVQAKRVPKGTSIVWAKIKGKSGDSDPLVPQSIRFPSIEWTTVQVRAWLSDNNIKSMKVEKASAKAASLTFIPGIDEAFVPAGAALSNDEGLPVRKFLKEVVKVGQYSKGDRQFNITAAVLDHWAVMFGEMRDNGVKVPIPSTHKGDGDPDKNRGYVTDMWVDSDALFMMCDLIGEEGIAAAQRSDVSLYSPSEFKDGKGKIYKQPIVHVALCTDPVVPGLEDFVPIAASMETDMKIDVEKIKKGLGIEVEVTEETLEAVLLSHGEAQIGIISGLTTKVKALEAAVTKGTSEPDKTLVSLSADNRKMKLDALVVAGRITPATCKRLTDTFIGDGNCAIALQLRTGGLDVFNDIVLAFKDNDVVALREKSGPQGVVLGGKPGMEDDGAKRMIADAERRAKEAKERQPVYA